MQNGKKCPGELQKEKHLELHVAAEKLDRKIYTIEESYLKEKKERKKAVELF